MLSDLFVLRTGRGWCYGCRLLALRREVLNSFEPIRIIEAQYLECIHLASRHPQEA